MVLSDKVLNGIFISLGIHQIYRYKAYIIGLMLFKIRLELRKFFLHGGHHDVQKCKIVFCPLFGIDISSPSIVFIRNTAGTACFSDEAFASGIQTAAAIKRTAHTIRRVLCI